MSSKTVYIVTHGKRGRGLNPDMTTEGVSQIRTLRSKLPASPSFVLCGTARRMLQVAEALKLEPNAYSAAVGGPEALDVIDDVEYLILADGTRILYSMDHSERHGAPSMRAIIDELPHDAVICSGRASIIMLGVPLQEALSGMVYAVTHEDGQITDMRVVD